jgi:hypothetical protein
VARIFFTPDGELTMRLRKPKNDAEVDSAEPHQNGTTATAEPPAEAAPTQNGKTQAAPPPAASTDPATEPAASETRLEGENEIPDRKPLKVFSYRIGADSFVHCSVWQRDGTRRDGIPFTTYDCSIRKRYRDYRDGEWKSYYSFHTSELYAVHHALQQASSFITDLRKLESEIPF